MKNRNTVGFNIRVMQECLSLAVLEQLSLAPSARPATLVARQFFLSPGRLQIEMCLDRSAVYYGDKVAMNVVISNSSTRTIRKIKVHPAFHLNVQNNKVNDPLFKKKTRAVQDLSSVAAVVHRRRAPGAHLRAGDDGRLPDPAGRHSAAGAAR